MKTYTIICVDIKIGDDSPIIIQNYGLMTKKQAQEKFVEIYNAEIEERKNTSNNNYVIEETDNYIGVLFDNNYENELNRREYYLQELEVK